MSANVIDNFEITSYGDLKIKTYHDGRSIETQYHSLPSSLIMKFLNLKKPPTVHDVEQMVNDWHAKQKKDSSCDDPVCCNSFWTDKE